MLERQEQPDQPWQEEQGTTEYSSLLPSTIDNYKGSQPRRDIPLYGQRKNWIPKSLEVGFFLSMGP